MIVALAALIACGGDAPPPELRALPPGAGPEVCAAEPFEQLRVACLVEAGARAGREGDSARAQAACDAVPEGTWRDECRFRAGEELGRAGDVAAAMASCAEAGRFARFCVTHAGWGVPPGTPGTAAAWAAAAAPLPEELRAEAEDILRARWWYLRYVGTGEADPEPARAAPPDEAPHARGAWAIEAVRLLDGDVAMARVAWRSSTIPRGPSLPPERRLGRYDAPFRIPGEEALPKVRTFGGGARLVGETPDEDLDIALLEALYFREATADGAAFRPWIDDPRPRVRYTALKLYRVLPSDDVEATLRAMADDPDPVVAAHVADALRYRTWLGKGNAPGLKGRRPPQP